MYAHINIAQLLIRIRSSKNLSQAEFSSPIYTQSLLSRIEGNDTQPGFTRTSQLLAHNNISLTEFEYLLQPPSPFQKLTHTALTTLDIVFIQNHAQKMSEMPIPYYNAFIGWLFNCFGIQIGKKIPQQQQDITRILDQDEFYNLDILLITYSLPMLPPENALYTYKRLLQQLEEHELSVSRPYLSIDAAISLATCFMLRNNQEQANYYYLLALEEARTLMSVHHLIILNLLLFRNTQDLQYHAQAQQLTALFLKDNFYDSWYNVLIRNKTL